MSLTLILGSSGSGKSWYIQNRMIVRSQEETEKRFLFIVPEQFTMQTQKDLILRHPRGGLLNIEVLSFQRLAWRIFEENGEELHDVLTETGRSLILRQVASAKKEELPALGRRMNRSGYVAKVKSALTEFAQYEIGAGELEEMIRFSDKRPQLQYKLRDLLTLMEAFDAFRRDRFMTGEELLEKLAESAAYSELLRSSVVILDGFTGFTPLQLKVIRTLLRVCPEVHACITIDTEETVFHDIQEHELFALSKKTIRAITRLAAQEHVPVCDPVCCTGDPGRFPAGHPIRTIEQRLFRLQENQPEKAAFFGKQDAVRIYAAAAPDEEVHAAARQIRRLVDRGEARWREIAVITGSPDDYEVHIRRSFERLGIPCFIDRKVSLNTNPCLEFLRSAVETVSTGYSYESMFRMLRTGFAGLSPEETDLMETYVLARGIRGKTRWTQAWEETIKTLTEEEVQTCEALRSRLMTLMGPFMECFAEAEGPLKDYVKGVTLLLEAFETEKHLAETEERFREEGDYARALEYSQIWGILSQLLEEACQLLGEEQVTRTEFAQIMEAGFEEARVGITPPGIDQVQVGDMERTRLENIKVLFFLGMNDGWIPGNSGESSLMSALDREFLAQEGVVLAPDAREKSCMQRFYLYLCMTKPSDRLWISYSMTAGDGSLLRPAYMIAVLQDLFPGLKAEDLRTREEDITAAVSFDDGILWAAGELGKIRGGEAPSERLLELFRQAAASPEAEEKIKTMCTAVFDGSRRMDRISRDLAAGLYGEVLKGSISRLELFASCAYGHFLKYGLRLVPREVYEVQAADLGTVFHNALRIIFEKIRRELPPGSRFGESAVFTREDVRKKMVEEALEESIDQWGRGIFADSARNSFIVVRMRRILQKTVWGLLDQIRRGSFEPAGFEVGFNVNSSPETAGVSPRQGNMELTGRIDRIDCCEDDGKVWLKVMDYKSGYTGFDLTGLLYGLQLQLPVYMNAARAMFPDRETAPGAMFYYRVKDTVTDSVWGDESAVEDEEVLRQLRPDGLLCSDPAVVDGLDRYFSKTSCAAPMEKKKDGSLTARSKAVSRERMELLGEYAEKMVKDLGERICSGEIRQEPYRRKNQTACERCGLREACPQDRRMPDCRYKQIKEFPDGDQLWQIIGQKNRAE